MVKHLLKFLPDDIALRHYREPFVGAGSLFFALGPQTATLTDANAHLINCYQQVRANPDLIHSYLTRHLAKTGEKYYYRIREKYNKSKPSAAQAARFIYLNKTCFNGVFRVNRLGEFNVPYGRKEPPSLPSRKHLSLVSAALGSAELYEIGYIDALADVGKSDFIYLDPPYPPLNGTSFFNHYTASRFTQEEQKKVLAAAQHLDRRGCKFMISNADTSLIRELYRDYNIHQLDVRRWVTANSKKHMVSELLITNYSLS